MNAYSIKFFDGALPWPWLATLIAAAIILLALTAYRDRRAAILRIIPFAGFILLLMPPQIIEETRAPLDPVALVIVDQSPSQQLGERPAQTQAALATLKDRLAQIEGLTVNVINSGSDKDTETDLFQTLQQSLSQMARDRLAGIFIISDGEIHDVPQDKNFYNGLPPIHTLLTGSKHMHNRRLVIEAAPKFANIGASAAITLRVIDETADGALDNHGLPLSITADNHTDVKSIPANKSVTVNVSATHIGENLVLFKIPAARDDIFPAHSQQAVSLTALGTQLNVLLISGKPTPATRMWRSLLKSDPNIELVHFTILRDGANVDLNPGKDVSLIELPLEQLFIRQIKDFNLIIFDNFQNAALFNARYLENIKSFVNDGGALLTIEGPAFAGEASVAQTQLADILPLLPDGAIHENDFTPALTPLGSLHPVTAELSGEAGNWGGWQRYLGTRPNPQISPQILMRADGAPLLAVAHSGAGRVAQLVSDHLWLWARGHDNGGPYIPLIRRLIHWLMKEPSLDENMLNAQLVNNQLTIEYVKIDGDAKPLHVIFPSGADEIVTLKNDGVGRWAATLPAADMGLYQITDGERTAVAQSGNLDKPEFQNLLPTAKLIQPALQATGGHAWWLEDGMNISLRMVTAGGNYGGARWLGLKQPDAYMVTGARMLDILPPWLLWIIVIGGMGFAWWREATYRK